MVPFVIAAVYLLVLWVLLTIGATLIAFVMGIAIPLVFTLIVGTPWGADLVSDVFG